MASSSISKPLPVLYDQVYVLFTMPANNNMWWKTTIDSITLLADNDVRAIAQVTFDSGTDTAGNYYAVEKSTMHFLHDDKAVLLSAHSSFQAGSGTLWKRQSDLQTGDLTNNNSKNSGKKTKQPAKIGEKRKIHDRDSSKTNTRVLRPRRAPSSKAVAPVKHEPEMTIDIESLSPHDNEIQSQRQASNNSELAIAVGNLNTLYSGLQREVFALQEKVHTMDKERLSKVQRQNTLEKRMYLNYELAKHQKRSLTLTSGETSFPFSSVFRRCPYEFSIECTLKDFAVIARDVHNQFEHGVHYLPSYPTITSEAQPLAQKHIVFESCESLFKWLETDTSMKEETITKKFMKRKGYSILQALGGAHWDINDDKRSLHFFFRRSSSRALPSVKTEQEIQPVLEDDSTILPMRTPITSTREVSCLSISSTEWDSQNNCFKHDFQTSSAQQSIHSINIHNILDYDAFTLSWKPLRGLRSHDIHKSSSSNGNIVLGKMVLFIPAVLFFGDQFTKKIYEMIGSIETSETTSSA